MYLFFKYTSPCINLKIEGEVSIRCIKPPMWRNLHTFLWRCLTLGKGTYVEYQLCVGETAVCTAEVISKLPFFPFMGKEDIFIGPCRTLPEHRGKGYYPFLLNHIVNGNPSKNGIMIVEENNHSSIRGVEKAGFRRYARGKKTFLKRYIITSTIES